MPIVIDDQSTTDDLKQVRTINPKTVFSSILTGSAGKRGLLDEHRNPGRADSINPAYFSIATRPVTRRDTQRDGDNATRYIPISVLSHGVIEEATGDRVVPDTSDLLQVENTDLWFGVDCQSITVHTTMKFDPQTGNRRSQHEVVTLYQLNAYLLPKGDETTAKAMNSLVPSAGNAQVVTLLSPTPSGHTTENFLRLRLSEINRSSANLDLDAVQDFMLGRSLYSMCQAAAETWTSEKVGEQAVLWIETMLDQHVAHHGALPTTQQGVSNNAAHKDALNMLVHQLGYLLNYEVSLESYGAIYQALSNRISTELMALIAKRNLNLLMISNLQDLSDLSGQLVVPPSTMPDGSPIVLPGGPMSVQQRAAITTGAPLSLIRAGAGTGKTTTFAGRTAYLINGGVDPSDITAISFTNAAAQAVTAKAPGVQSMTISRMVMDIFNANITSHYGRALEVVEAATLSNTLLTYFRNDPLAQDMKQLLNDIAFPRGRGNEVLMDLNTYVERNYDAVLNMLRTVGQVTLELQSVICYQRVHQMVVPQHVGCKFLMLDEVQDNSIFDFIFVLRFAAHHLCNVFMVGDANQTMYEFRFSNPKALNALEASGVFETHNLTTNFRSNQEILDMANVSLSNIEANQYAQIQLQANNMQLPTEKSFTDRVHVQVETGTSKAFDSALGETIIEPGVGEFIDRAVNDGRQVAVLAHSRRNVGTMYEALTARYPGAKIANLVSERSFSPAFFSKFTSEHWDMVRAVHPKDASFTVTKEMVNLAKELAPYRMDQAKAEQMISKQLTDWRLADGHTVDGWVQQVAIGTMTRDAFFDHLCHSLISFEVRRNAVRQAMVRERNRARQETLDHTDADIVLSTVHGVKGLEFPRTVVVYKDSSQMSEADKRLYYVAFTRAQEELYVLVSSTLNNPRIVSDYESLVNSLAERDAQLAAQQQAGQPGDTDGEPDGDLDGAQVAEITESLDLPEPGPEGSQSQVEPMGQAPTGDTDVTDDES